MGKWKQQQQQKNGGGDTATLLKALLGAGGGGGGGKSGWKNPSADMISRVAKKNPEKTVWIGGLGKAIGKEGNKKLKAHIESLAGTGPKFVNIDRKGQGGAIFASEAEAQAAIASVNGTSFMGKTLEVDVWVKRPKT